VDGLIRTVKLPTSRRAFLAKNGDIKYGLMSCPQAGIELIFRISSITAISLSESWLRKSWLSAEELQRRNDELARLYRASGSLISGASINLQIWPVNSRGCFQQEFGQRIAACWLFPGTRTNYFVWHRRPVYRADERTRGDPGRAGPGPRRRSVRVDAQCGQRSLGAEYLSNWEAAQSELAIPLKIGNHGVGVIDVQSSEAQAFSPDDERLMSFSPKRAALVLEHSRLNAQTEKQIQQLLALRTIDMAISSSFDLSMTLGVLWTR